MAGSGGPGDVRHSLRGRRGGHSEDRGGDPLREQRGDGGKDPAGGTDRLNIRKPELLLPAGSMEVFRTVLDYGADAVYIGGETFGLRAMAKNFSAEEMAEAVALAHARGKKVYVTANILAHDADLEGAEELLTSVRCNNAVKPGGFGGLVFGG